MEKYISFYLFIILFLRWPTYSFSIPLEFQEETETIREILMELIEARGFLPEKGIPDILIDSTDLGSSPAGMTLKTNELFVHPKTIRICKKFGEDYKDALAAIVGHELVHFYQQKKCRFTHWLQGEDSLEYEADLQGLFNVYLAGYKIKGKEAMTFHAQLTDKIYKEFDLSENPSYPSLVQRKEMAHRTEQTVNELVSLFEMANYATLSGYFQIAIALNNYLLANLETKEFHNNIAIAYASLYKQLNSDGFTYPFELNIDSRLYYPIRSEDLGINEDSIQLKAIRHFCEGSENTYEVEIFEIALAIIRGDFILAKKKIMSFPKGKYPLKVKQLGKILTKKQGEKKPVQVIINSSAAPYLEDCEIRLKYLDEYHPSLSLTKEVYVLFEPKNGVTAIRFGAMRFVVQSFEPNCSKIIIEEPINTVLHSKGAFHLFTEEGVIFTEKQGEIIKVAKVWPNFMQ